MCPRVLASWFWLKCLLLHYYPLQLVPDWNIDAPSYDFKKLDPSKEEDRQIVNKYLLGEGDFGGKEVADGKIFK